jgi:acetyltransferase-like isoleucine patch superfamily enzyme
MIRVRGMLFGLIRGVHFHKAGRLVKIRGARHICVGQGVSVGDFCWIEAITQFAGVDLSPKLELDDGVSLSDLTHISCASHVHIGENCLIGSKVYIGDHSHGSLSNTMEMFSIPPAKRPLGDIAEIEIGKNSWICDGAVILAGTRLASHSVVGANSVVRLQTDRPALIAGVPAKVIRYLD